MTDVTVYDKRAKNLRYVSDKKGFKQSRWEDLTEKERDYWRARIQQSDQDRNEFRTKKEKA
jgi:hypothetical protein|tara:strand:+ start:2655 stop:2837 length:183 start_codon:yes stop_codon:yes gene_type:complete